MVEQIKLSTEEATRVEGVIMNAFGDMELVSRQIAGDSEVAARALTGSGTALAMENFEGLGGMGVVLAEVLAGLGDDLSVTVDIGRETDSDAAAAVRSGAPDGDIAAAF
ncbi:hypothetical protein [Streptomyces bohaiensis]|uniref:Uncharacterized protein n=1 Tax=Streptomyces bohaiensis TaxID=1431344 RepID=A0ABX1CCT4_9ACTN|nr:hypothetical protein [Streptomyces bohaiensis]NJQ15718.1 hypothetical protein [Streptomyces bohaiensis]